MIERPPHAARSATPWAELHSFKLLRLAVTHFGDTLGQPPVDTIRQRKIDSTPGWAAVIETKKANARCRATGVNWRRYPQKNQSERAGRVCRGPLLILIQISFEIPYLLDMDMGSWGGEAIE